MFESASDDVSSAASLGGAGKGKKEKINTSNASSQEYDDDYEERARERLSGWLFQSCGIRVFPSRDFRFRRKIYARDCETRWPESMSSSEEVEIDFFAHVLFSTIDNIQVANPKPTPYVQVFLFNTAQQKDSSAMKTPSKEPSCQKLSPENPADADVEGVRLYAIGEVTTSRGKGVETKLDQLEKDCSIAMMLSGADDVSQAVGVAVLVSPTDKSGYIFQSIRSNERKYPLLRQIAELKRFMFVCYSETNCVRIAHIEKTLGEVQSSQLEIRSDQLEIRSDQLKIRSDQRTFLYLQSITILTILAGVFWVNRNK